jgi:replicative DNA helicase
MVKYRPARSLKHGENKNWCQSDSDTSPILFNMNRINVTQPLLIVEGEGDAMSAIEAGYFNTVSVPLGAGNLHWIEENWDWLEQFKSIIIASDNDEAGQKMRKECIYRLGTWRTKYVEYPKEKTTEKGTVIPIKDMNDTLQSFGSGYVMSMIINAKDVPVASVTDFTDVDELDISEMNGVTTGLKPLDKELLKVFNGTLTILSGRPGSGKTSLIDQIIASTIDEDNPVFLFSKEMPERMSTNWFNFILSGRRNLVEKTTLDGEKYHVVSQEAKNKIKEYYHKKLYIYKDTESNAIEDVMQSMEDCVRKYGVKLLVLDNLMMLDLECNETEKNNAQTKLINDLIKFASKFNVSVCLIAHPRKTQQMNTEIEMYDIAGSSNIINLAMRSIGLRRISKKEQEDVKNPFRKYNVVLTIMKDRLLGKADIQMGLYYDVKSRRFFTDYDEFDHVYKWDDKQSIL